MIVENITGILEENKLYMNPDTGEIYSGKIWIRILDSSPYEHIYANDLKSLIEIKSDKNQKHA